MNDFAAINLEPDDAKVLKVFREPHVGEWASATKLCKEVLWEGLPGRGELERVVLVLDKFKSLAKRGLLDVTEVTNLPAENFDWVRLNGQMVNTGDVNGMAPFMGHPIARGLALAYRITPKGESLISSNRIVRPMVLSVMITATAACSSFREVEPILEKRRQIEPVRQLTQERNQAGRVIWSYCENDCPKPTPKVLALPIPQPVVSLVATKSIVSMAQNEVTETLRVSIFFKLNSSTISAPERAGLKAILASGGPWKSILVTGRADPVGADSLNQKLSRKRAQEISVLLETAGMERGIVSGDVRVELSKVNAEAITFSKTPNRLDQQSRRVDVELVRTKKPQGNK
jgi:outer membrane protein OmpA-like peptidoglycan-associated protein